MITTLAEQIATALAAAGLTHSSSCSSCGGKGFVGDDGFRRFMQRPCPGCTRHPDEPRTVGGAG